VAHSDVTAQAEKEFAQAKNALATNNTLAALPHLEHALKLRDFPGWYSYLGICVAKERGQHRKGEELCQASLAAEPDNPVHFINLARTQLIAGNRAAALQSLREGMTHGGSPELERLLNGLGERKPPLIPALSRNNPLNRYLGLLLHRLGLR
jgi:Flp pilus assembly protein TadD